MLPNKSWLVRFVCNNGNVEVWEHVFRDYAEEQFNSFDESDADIYTRIQLIERDWTKDENNCDTIIDEVVF